jgi:hypothetical protein
VCRALREKTREWAGEQGTDLLGSVAGRHGGRKTRFLAFVKGRLDLCLEGKQGQEYASGIWTKPPQTPVCPCRRSP